MARLAPNRFAPSVACLTLALMAPPAQAADLPPIYDALKQEFRVWQIGGSWFGKNPDGPGVKDDGSIWWESVNNPLLGKGPDKPRKWWTQRCMAELGQLAQLLPMSTSHAPAQFTDPSTGETVSVWGRMLLRWSWQAAPLPSVGIDEQSLNLAAPELGLFTCTGRDGRPLWHVAVTIATHPTLEGLSAIRTGREDEIRLSLRMVDAKLIKATARILADEDRQRLVLGMQRSSEDRKRTEFQRSLEIGTRTNCGLVIGLNGPLVQVQVPSYVRLRNGATQTYVSRQVIDVPGGADCIVE